MSAVHPRTLIRHAVVVVLKKNPAVIAICGQRIFSNRQDPWDESELPAMGVYQTSETPLETDISPPRDERSLDLSCEVLAQADEKLEDILDAVSLALERDLDLKVIGAELGEADTLLEIKFTGFELGLADDGNRLVGVAIVNFTLDYEMPKVLPEAAEFRQTKTGWDLAGSDPDHIDAKDITTMPGWENP
jgi:hypothetical protein